MNIKKIEITRHADLGHSWGEVPLELLSKKIRQQISLYSYRKRDTVFLEEDCDLPLVVDYFKSEGVEVSFNWVHTNLDSPCRSYPRYKRP